MILESAILDIRAGDEAAFEIALRRARPLIASSPGFVSLEVRRCVETANRYLLLVQWRSLEDHTIGFRQSERYRRWQAQLHHFYEPFPTVEHYGNAIDLDVDA